MHKYVSVFHIKVNWRSTIVINCGIDSRIFVHSDIMYKSTETVLQFILKNKNKKKPHTMTLSCGKANDPATVPELSRLILG